MKFSCDLWITHHTNVEVNFLLRNLGSIVTMYSNNSRLFVFLTFLNRTPHKTQKNVQYILFMNKIRVTNYLWEKKQKKQIFFRKLLLFIFGVIFGYFFFLFFNVPNYFRIISKLYPNNKFLTLPNWIQTYQTQTIHLSL